MIPRDALRRLLRTFPGVVILDEAYIEFAGADASHVPLLAESDRLLLVRTMSKAYGLAGMRVGYAIGAPALVGEVEKSRGPYKVNALAESVALAALQHDREWVHEHVTLAIANRLRLEDELRAMGLSPIASSANFTCVPVSDCVAVGQAMRARGVAVRPFPALPHVGDTLRISVGPWPMVQAALDALRSVLAERGPLRDTDTIAIPRGAA
jgi:histidinol-phosphate/aromatic aminotransferase/cobyric acid decarboxylase-like protein